MHDPNWSEYLLLIYCLYGGNTYQVRLEYVSQLSFYQWIEDNWGTTEKLFVYNVFPLTEEVFYSGLFKENKTRSILIEEFDV